MKRVMTEVMGFSLSILCFEGKVGFVYIMKETDFCANNLKGSVGFRIYHVLDRSSLRQRFWS